MHVSLSLSSLLVMVRLDPRIREDTIQPAHVRAPNEALHRLVGPLLRAMTVEGFSPPVIQLLRDTRFRDQSHRATAEALRPWAVLSRRSRPAPVEENRYSPTHPPNPPLDARI